MIGRLEISLEAIRKNADVLRRLVAPVRAAFVVKGNAYGHGLLPVARTVEPLADLICVYTIDEALALRGAGIAAPVLLLGPMPPDAFDDVIAAKVEIALWDAGAFAGKLRTAARKRGQTVPVHLKVNSGLNRLGFEPNELRGALAAVAQVPEIAIAGIFSHLASAEELDSPYTMQQLGTFEAALAEAAPLLKAREIEPARHIAASAAAMLWPQTRLDLVRFGIALYGLIPSPQTREALRDVPPALQPALSYRSQIVVVRTVAAGTSVGYGGSFHAPNEMRIGVVPAGYADGVPRALSNRGAFLVDGVRCPIIGRVAMNMTEIDLSHTPAAHPGSTVTLIGRDGDAEVTADDWAAWCDTINYEIVTRLPAGLPRIYEGG